MHLFAAEGECCSPTTHPWRNDAFLIWLADLPLSGAPMSICSMNIQKDGDADKEVAALVPQPMIAALPNSVSDLAALRKPTSHLHPSPRYKDIRRASEREGSR